MKNSNIITILIVVLILGGLYFFMRSEGGDNMDFMEDEMEEVMEEQGNEMMEEQGDEMSEMMNEVGDSYAGKVLAGKESPLLDFTEADYKKALSSDKLIVLYFYANWCPVCRAEFPKMQEVFNGLIGDGVIGFRVNYNDNQTDSAEKDLARMFGVAYQHTKVFVKNGERVLKSPEGWDEARYEEEISKFY